MKLLLIKQEVLIVEFSLRWYEHSILSSAGTAATFAITDAKFYVPVVTLKTEDNAKLSKLLNEGFKRSVYWNHYKILLRDYAANENTRERLDASFQGVSKLFVLAYQRGNDKYVNEEAFNKYFLPKIKIKKYNVEIDGRNFYDQAINDSIKQYDEVRKKSTGQGDDYTTGCLLDFVYLEKNCRLIATNFSKQKALDAEPKAIQQIIFTGQTDNRIRVFNIFQQSKETILQFPKGTTKVLSHI